MSDYASQFRLNCTPEQFGNLVAMSVKAALEGDQSACRQTLSLAKVMLAQQVQALCPVEPPPVPRRKEKIEEMAPVPPIELPAPATKEDLALLSTLAKLEDAFAHPPKLGRPPKKGTSEKKRVDPAE